MAEIRQPTTTDRSASRDDLAYRELVDSGVLVPAANPDPKVWSRIQPLRLPRGTAQALIDAERGER